MLITKTRHFCLALFALLLAACGPVTAAPPVSQTSSPPPATLEIDGKTQTAGIGSYCWSDRANAAQEVCVDLEGVPTAREALIAANTPYQARFRLPLGTPPDSLYIAVLPAGVEIVGGANDVRLWTPGAGWAGELPLKNEIDYEFQEGPGLYILQLSAHWKNFGDASYGFLVQVGEQANPTLPPSTAAPTPAPLALQTLSPLMRIGKGAANLLALSKDGRWLAIGTPLGVYLYETATQREIWFRAFDGELRDLAFRPDGAQLAVSLSGNQMPIVDTQTGETALTLQGEAGLRGVWSPDGRSILTGGECEQVLIWDAHSGQVTHTLQPVKCNIVTPGYVNAVWSGDGKRIYVTDRYLVSAWDAETYQLLPDFAPKLSEDGLGSAMFPSPTDNVFVLSNNLNVYLTGETNISILDGETGKLVRALRTPSLNGPIMAMIWSRDGKRLVAAGYHMLCVWDVKSGKLISTTRDYSVLFDLAFMPDDETLVGLFTDENALNAININTNKPVFALSGFESWHAIGWDNNELLTFNGVTAARWNPITGQIIERHASLEPEQVRADAALHSPDGLIVLSKAASDIQRKQKLLELHGKLIDNNLSWSPDGKHLVSDHPYDELPPVIWDTQTGDVLGSLDFVGVGPLHPYLEPMEWSPDSKWVAGGGSLMNMSNGANDGFVTVWDAQTGQQTALLLAGMKSDRIQSLAWSPDLRWLAVGGYSGKIFLWDMQTQTLSAVLIGHVGYVLHLNWSPDGKLLASSGDSTVLVWKAPGRE